MTHFSPTMRRVLGVANVYQDLVRRYTYRGGDMREQVRMLEEVPAGALTKNETYYTIHTHRVGRVVGKSLGVVFVRWADAPYDALHGNPASNLHPDVRVLRHRES